MAGQRYISTSFWDDEWVQTLSPIEKLVFMYLMTNPLTTIAGVYKITMKRFCFDTGLDQEQVKSAMDSFEKEKKVFWYEGYIIMPSWPKHQKWEAKATIKKGIESVIGALPPVVRTYMVSVGYAYPMDTVSIPYAYHVSYSDSDFDIDSDFENSATAENPAASGPEPEPSPVSPESPLPPKKAKKPKAELSQDEKDLRDEIRAAFDSQNTRVDGKPWYPNFAIEGKKVLELVAICRSANPQDPRAYAQALLETFRKLTLSHKGTLAGKPFTASLLATNWVTQAVIQQMRKEHETTAGPDPLMAEIEAREAEQIEEVTA